MRSDSEVLSDVVRELHWDPAVTADGIGATVRDGIVTLVGHVPSYAEKQAAEEIVTRVTGVRAVVQDLEVRLPTMVEISDGELASRAATALEWNVFVPKPDIGIHVEGGRITLTGAVRYEFQRSTAERVLRELAGVRALVNNVVVSPGTASPRQAVEAEIDNALTRRGDFRETVP